MSLNAEPPEGGDPTAGIEGMSYERARDELVSVVQRLEAGQVPLEDAMKLWERGEALANHCQAWLDQARARLDTLSQQQSQPTSPENPTF